MIVIENPETGETRQIKSGESFTAPWRVKDTVANMPRAAVRAVKWANYPFRKCSSCGQMGIFEGT